MNFLRSILFFPKTVGLIDIIVGKQIFDESACPPFLRNGCLEIHKHCILADDLDDIPRQDGIVTSSEYTEKSRSSVNYDIDYFSAAGVDLDITDTAEKRSVLYTDDLLFSHIGYTAVHCIAPR